MIFFKIIFCFFALVRGVRFFDLLTCTEHDVSLLRRKISTEKNLDLNFLKDLVSTHLLPTSEKLEIIPLFFENNPHIELGEDEHGSERPLFHLAAFNLDEKLLKILTEKCELFTIRQNYYFILYGFHRMTFSICFEKGFFGGVLVLQEYVFQTASIRCTTWTVMRLHRFSTPLSRVTCHC
jgi:hypothetical protein